MTLIQKHFCARVCMAKLCNNLIVQQLSTRFKDNLIGIVIIVNTTVLSLMPCFVKVIALVQPYNATSFRLHIKATTSCKFFINKKSG